MRYKLSFIFIAVLFIFPLFTSSLYAKTYTLGIPDRPLSTTYKKLFKVLMEKGYLAGENLRIIKINFDKFDNPEEKQKIKYKIENETDVFFATGDFLKPLFALEIQSPVIFLGLKETDREIPDAMKDNTT